MPVTPEVLADASRQMTKARSALLIDHPWFGALALRLKPVAEDTRGQLLMATDGTHLFYDPAEVLKVAARGTTTVVAHEVLHCALLHVFRRGNRDPKVWNVACDHVVNLALEENGFEFPTGQWAGHREKRFTGMTAEQVYEILRREQQSGDKPGPDGPLDLRQPPKAGGGAGGQPGQAPGTPDKAPGNGAGDGGPQPTPAAEAPMGEVDWEIAAEQAAMTAKKAGKLPGSMERLIKQAREPKVDWAAVLRRFVTQAVPFDYSWSTPNRRHVHTGLYLPGIYNESTAKGVVVVDTSGSVDQRMLDQAAGELTAILQEARPESLTVIYCDTRVQGEAEVFTPDGGDVELRMRGGGGTAFQPAFDWVDEHMEEPPAFLVYLTDLYASDIGTIEEPEYPVLFATTVKTSQVAPWGETVRCEVDG